MTTSWSRPREEGLIAEQKYVRPGEKYCPLDTKRRHYDGTVGGLWIQGGSGSYLQPGDAVVDIQHVA